MMSIARDMTPTVDMTRHKGVGPERQRRPVYVDLLPPCNAACPAGENIQAWLALAQAGKFRAAWETLIADNPMPAVHGRVCYHPCESNCNRKELDSSVGIHAVERFLGDMAARESWPSPKPAPASGKRVLVVGAGPSGLSAAWHLARLGHAVEIHEAGPLPGGMLHFGIPAYRLPREDLMKEIRRIEAMGVKIVLNHRVDDVLAEQRDGGFDAVFIAIGAHVSKHVDIPARDAVKVLDAVKLLRDVESGEAPLLGRRVLVYGGGNTAMDAARTARRLGAEEAMIVYRRDRAHMPAHEFEADEALAEGVKIKWLTSIKEIDGGDFTVERMEIGEDGRAKPTGEFETLQADAVVLALGQEAEFRLPAQRPGHRLQGRRHGHRRSRHDDRSAGHLRRRRHGAGGALRHRRDRPRQEGGAPHRRFSARRSLREGEKHPVVDFAGLNLPIYSDATPSAERHLSVEERGTGFEEIVAGLGEAEAVHEARRCLSCGNCFECDNCFAACPEDAIEKLGPGSRYRIDYRLCTGCAVCVEQCPCHAMEMIAEPA